jgi:hypothetical protein
MLVLLLLFAFAAAFAAFAAAFAAAAAAAAAVGVALVLGCVRMHGVISTRNACVFVATNIRCYERDDRPKLTILLGL